MWPIPSGLIVRGVAGAFIVGALWVWGFTVGTARANGRIDKANNAALIQRAAESASLAVKINETQKVNDAAIKTLQDGLVAMRRHDEQLRKRADRPLPGSTAATVGQVCTGATGAELSTVDAGFSRWYATAAAGQSIALAKCYGDLDNLIDAMQKASP